MNVLRFYIPHVVLYFFIIILDQWTKSYAQITHINVQITSFARFVYLENRGIAFSLPLTGVPLQIVTIFLIVLIMAAIIRFRVYQKKLLFLFLVMILAGAVGNAIDRLSLGYVIDFISIGTFPVFNIADSFVSIGAVGVILSSWKKKGMF